MASDNPDGAVDHDFDEAAIDPADVIAESLSDYPRDIDAGDIVIDLVQGRPLYVASVAAPTAAEYMDTHDFDLTTYKAHPWLPVGPSDTVFKCVFLPTKPQDIPSSRGDSSYDYPRGRLARVPVEWLYDDDTHRARKFETRTLARLFAAFGGASMRPMVDAAADAFDTDSVRKAVDAAGGDPDGYGSLTDE